MDSTCGACLCSGLSVQDTPPQLHLRQRSFPPMDDAHDVSPMVEDDEQGQSTTDAKEERVIVSTREKIQKDNADRNG
ncbi:hypothetical protein J7J63_06260, partial [Candidatus Bipolaricaulota bacterium]|nr:hypothetical protein [Candidatus Bipolaricaulota bacterium]